jgi:hypothetical protein
LVNPEKSCSSCLCLTCSILDLRLGDADNAAGQASASVACGLGLQVVGVGMNYDAATDDGAVAAQFRHWVNVFEVGDSALIGFDVAHIAGVTLWRFGRRVWRAGRIEMAARR